MKYTYTLKMTGNYRKPLGQLSGNLSDIRSAQLHDALQHGDPWWLAQCFEEGTIKGCNGGINGVGLGPCCIHVVTICAHPCTCKALMRSDQPFGNTGMLGHPPF